jgi:hypothetical protein
VAVQVPSAPADPPEADRLWTFFSTFALLFQSECNCKEKYHSEGAISRMCRGVIYHALYEMEKSILLRVPFPVMI